jgi:putative ABC transport system substrate-binding protein
MGQIGRRDFLVASGALLAAPLARAQQAGRMFRVGAILGVGAAAWAPYRAALAEQLASQGLVEGRNLALEVRGAVGVFHQDRELARELLAAKCDALFTCTDGVTEAAYSATKNVPIVFTWVADPVNSKVVKSYAKPGGNVTGVTNRWPEMLLKHLELARDLIPAVRRVATLGGTANSAYLAHAPALRAAAARMGIDVQEFHLLDGMRAVGGGAQAIIVVRPFALQAMWSGPFIRQALAGGVATIYPDLAGAENGALASYGTNLVDDVRRGAGLLARVLKGAKPADLPVDQAARFELAINLKTAQKLGIKVSQAVLLRADRVIE